MLIQFLITEKGYNAITKNVFIFEIQGLVVLGMASILYTEEVS